MKTPEMVFRVVMVSFGQGKVYVAILHIALREHTHTHIVMIIPR